MAWSVNIDILNLQKHEHACQQIYYSKNNEADLQ